MKSKQRIKIRPKVKGRPRMTRSGRAYTPKETLEYENAFAEMYKGKHFAEGNLSVSLVFDVTGVDVLIEEINLETSKLKGDIDNYVKAVLDALNGVAWTDDKQVVELIAKKI